MSRLRGCHIETLDDASARGWVDWVMGRRDAPRAIAGPAWLLAHCDGGVTWGWLEHGRWRLGSEAFPDLCPKPDEGLQELRVFTPAVELLLWRDADALRGRSVRDDGDSAPDDPLRPCDEMRVLVSGRVIDRRNGFTRVRDGTGREHALPGSVPDRVSSSWPRLRVRHYFLQDGETGAVRVALTRLVEVT